MFSEFDQEDDISSKKLVLELWDWIWCVLEMGKGHGRSVLLVVAGILIGWGLSSISSRISAGDDPEAAQESSSEMNRKRRSTGGQTRRREDVVPKKEESGVPNEDRSDLVQVGEISERWKNALFPGHGGWRCGASAAVEGRSKNALRPANSPALHGPERFEWKFR